VRAAAAAKCEKFCVLFDCSFYLSACEMEKFIFPLLSIAVVCSNLRDVRGELQL
jgi:hypothetical protein